MRAIGMLCSGSETCNACQNSSDLACAKTDRSAVDGYAYAKSAMLAMPEACKASTKLSGICSS